MSVSAYRLDHIGIVVSSIDQALGVYEALGLKESGRELVESQAVRTAFLPLGETPIPRSRSSSRSAVPGSTTCASPSTTWRARSTISSAAGSG